MRIFGFVHKGSDTPFGAMAETPVDVDYQVIAASQTSKVLGTTGGAGNLLKRILIIPGTTSPGAVSIKDGSGAAVTIFTGGATSVADLKPFVVELAARSTLGPWSITTGANVTAVAVGSFT